MDGLPSISPLLFGFVLFSIREEEEEECQYEAERLNKYRMTIRVLHRLLIHSAQQRMRPNTDVWQEKHFSTNNPRASLSWEKLQSNQCYTKRRPSVITPRENTLDVCAVTWKHEISSENTTLSFLSSMSSPNTDFTRHRRCFTFPGERRWRRFRFTLGWWGWASGRIRQLLLSFRWVRIRLRIRLILVRGHRREWIIEEILRDASVGLLIGMCQWHEWSGK